VTVSSSPDDYKLKMIDFGSAITRENYVTDYMQSRYYRAPEVILQTRRSQAMDMWSVGCTLAELYFGPPLFPGATNYDMLEFFTRIIRQAGLIQTDS
jgi:dual specificity protein kinase YAK1